MAARRGNGRDALLASLVDGIDASARARADVERLLCGSLPFAERMLIDHGQFYPFGAALTRRAIIVPVAAQEHDELTAENGLIEAVRADHRRWAAHCVATATIYEVTMDPDAPGRSADAIAVELDHAGGMSLVVFLGYRVVAGGVRYAGTSVRPGAAGVFPRTDVG